MEEYIDIVDELGKATGEILEKDEAHRHGKWHNTAHIWIYNSKGEILLQKRSLNKSTFAGLWDISVAGHISTGETMEIGACREASEELGITITPDQLEKIFILKESYFHEDINWYNNEFHHVYLYKYHGTIDSLTLQKEEVDSVRFINHSDLDREISNTEKFKKFVGEQKYYRQIISAVLERI